MCIKPWSENTILTLCMISLNKQRSQSTYFDGSYQLVVERSTIQMWWEYVHQITSLSQQPNTVLS